LIAIDPTTGLISDPIALNGAPQASCIALSGNGRYLYVGLSDSPAVARVDLSASTYSATRLWLGYIEYTSANFPQDIEVLDGDGTSFITAGSRGAAVYDGEVRRPQITSINTANRIERGSSPGSFVGLYTGTSGSPASVLTVTPNGVTITRTVRDAIFGNEIRTGGNILFSSAAQLADATTLAVRASVGGYGQPCVDAPNGRVYSVSGTEIRAFDSSNGARKGTFYLPSGRSDDWATTAVRWGVDGFAIAGAGNVYLARWSAVDRLSADENGDGIADLWALEHFGTINIDVAADADRDGIPNALEHFFGTPPTQANANPLQFAIETVGDSRVIHLVFPKRASIPAAHYLYQASADLQRWNAAAKVTETVLSTQTIGGVQYQIIDAAIPAPAGAGFFVRVKWLGPQ
jgi:predicted RecA/RadA family phage recombinase